jgi:hypothetical protein
MVCLHLLIIIPFIFDEIRLTVLLRDGNDGRWSSFAIQIGTPPQVVRLLPSTSGNSIWTVLDLACKESDGVDCPLSRGNVFKINASTTWVDKGLYQLPLTPLHYLPYSGNAQVGSETITVPNKPSLQSMNPN